MSKLRSARRKLNEKYIRIAQEVTQKRKDFVKELVKERIKKDAEFASDVLKAVGELLPEDFKKIAEETIANETSQKTEAQINALTRGVILDGKLLNANWVPSAVKIAIESAKGFQQEIVNEVDIPLEDGFVATQSDGGGTIIVHETEHPNYIRDGNDEERRITEES